MVRYVEVDSKIQKANEMNAQQKGWETRRANQAAAAREKSAAAYAEIKQRWQQDKVFRQSIERIQAREKVEARIRADQAAEDRRLAEMLPEDFDGDYIVEDAGDMLEDEPDDDDGSTDEWDAEDPADDTGDKAGN